MIIRLYPPASDFRLRISDFRLRTSCYYDHNFAFYFFLWGVVGDEFGQGGGGHFLKFFGEFATYAGLAVGAAVFGQLLQTFHQPERRLIEDERDGQFGQVQQARLAALLVG